VVASPLRGASGAVFVPMLLGSVSVCPAQQAAPTLSVDRGHPAQAFAATSAARRCLSATLPQPILFVAEPTGKLIGSACCHHGPGYAALMASRITAPQPKFHLRGRINYRWGSWVSRNLAALRSAVFQCQRRRLTTSVSISPTTWSVFPGKLVLATLCPTILANEHIKNCQLMARAPKIAWRQKKVGRPGCTEVLAALTSSRISGIPNSYVISRAAAIIAGTRPLFPSGRRLRPTVSSSMDRDNLPTRGWDRFSTHITRAAVFPSTSRFFQIGYFRGERELPDFARFVSRTIVRLCWHLTRLATLCLWKRSHWHGIGLACGLVLSINLCD